MDDAEKYKNRHGAVLEYANGAMFKVDELDKWGPADAPFSFQDLLAASSTAGHDPAGRLMSFEHLSNDISWYLVPENMDQEKARRQLHMAHDPAIDWLTVPDDADFVSRLRDLTMTGYSRRLLCAVYDGDLNLYSPLAGHPQIDVEAARRGYEENPGAFLEASRGRIIARTIPAPMRSAVAHNVRNNERIAKARPQLELWLNRDLWTRRQAILFCAGYDPDATTWRESASGLGDFHVGQVVYLDGRAASQSVDVAPQHPEEAAALLDLWRLSDDSQGTSLDEIRPPAQWIGWATGCGVTPYWLYWAARHVPKLDLVLGGAAPVNGQEPPRDPDARELALVNVDIDQWAGMDLLQRRKTLKAIASTKEMIEARAGQRVERQAQGRYTINEAAQEIAGAGERLDPLVEKLVVAAASVDIRMYGPGEQARYEYRNGRQVRPFYEEAYWDDLNRWLDENEKRVTFRFPKPDTQNAEFSLKQSNGSRPEAYMLSTAELITEQTTYWERRQPAPLYDGTDYSEELLKQTTLTRYLQYDTWTPAAAALLVSGLRAPLVEGDLCTEIPDGHVQGLDGLWRPDTFGAIADAKRVLGIWRAHENPSTSVSPFDFIVWCKAKGIDTAWLSNIENDPQWQKEIAAAWLRLQKAREQLPPTVIEEIIGKYGELFRALFSPANVQVAAIEKKCLPLPADANGTVSGIQQAYERAREAAARMETEKWGYEVRPEDVRVHLHPRPEQLDDISQDETVSMSVRNWIEYLADEIAERQQWGEEESEAKLPVVRSEFLNLFVRLSDTLPLRQELTGTRWEGANLPQEWLTRLLVSKTDLRAWAKIHALEIANSRLLAQADMAADAQTDIAQPATAAPDEPKTVSVINRARGKLTSEQRAQIVQRGKQGETHQKLADEFGVTRQYVTKLCSESPKNTATWMPSATNKGR